MESMDLETWNENFEKTVDLFGAFLMKNLSVSHLVLFIDLEEVNKITRRLHHLENIERKPEEAAKEFLDAMKRSDEPGRWKMFVDALKEVGGEDSVILHHLLHGDEPSDPWLDHEEHRKLISRILMKEPLCSSLNVKALLPVMIEEGLISIDLAKKIRARCQEGEMCHANMEVITAMQSHKINWYRKFLTILYNYDDDHRELAMMIDPEFCKEKLEQSKKKASEPAQEQETGVLSVDGHHQSTAQTSSRGDAENDHPESVPRQTEENPQATSLPQATALHSTSHGEMGAPALKQTQPTCGCRCCAQLLEKVTSLESAVLAFQSEIKQLVTTASEGSQ